MKADSIIKDSSLNRRVFLLSVSGILLMLTIVGLSDYGSMLKSLSQYKKEHQLVARSVANNLESMLRRDLIHLQEIPFAKGFSLEDSDLAPERNALHAAWLQCGYSSTFLADAAGNGIWAEPATQSIARIDFSKIAAIRDALRTGKPSVTNVLDVSLHTRAALCLVPIRTGGAISGILGGQLEVNAPVFRKLWQNLQLDTGSRIEISDGNNVLLASSERQVASREMARDSNSEIIESATIPGISWSVRVIHPEQTAFAPLEQMKQRFIVLGLLFVGLTLLLTWGVTRSVIAPVRQLTLAAEKIASGNLQEQVLVPGKEEIGRLGRTLDLMRKKLKESMEAVEDSNKELERRVAERTSEVQTLLRKIISAQEEERIRIARDLHDDISQNIAALRLDLDSLKLEEANRTEQHTLEHAKQLSIHSLDSIHRMIFDLRPAILDDLGLSAAIQWYAEQRLKPLGIQMYFEGDAFDLRLPGEIETALFRIAQEGMTNIARHSRAETVFITMEHDKDSLILELEDDGAGFDLADSETITEKGRGLGLHGMRERASLVGGHLLIESKPGEGTRIIVTVPLREAIPA